MIINGQTIKDELALEMKETLSNASAKLTLGIVYVGDHPVIDRFVAIKKRFADSIGVNVKMIKLDELTAQSDVINQIESLSKETDGLIVQLPLPPHLTGGAVLAAIPESHDVDMLSESTRAAYLSGEEKMLPPVVGAIAEIITRFGLDLSGKKIAVIGQGELVGRPVLVWLRQKGYQPTVFTKEDMKNSNALSDMDVIISGAGNSGIIKPEMIKGGAIIIDAGTSEVEGALKGDADPECASKCSLFTPVPGGVGPVTVAMLFKNLLIRKGLL